MSAAAPGGRAQLRAALIALAVLAYGFTAAPLPRGMRPESLRTPEARAELVRWVELLGSIGISTTPEQLEELALSAGGAAAGAREAVVSPLRGWYRFSGTGQGWGLFTYPDLHPRALVIEGRTGDGPWRRLYRSLDPEATWRAEIWRHRRLRAPLDTVSRREHAGSVYSRFVRWAAGLALSEHPELDAIRISFERRHSTPPGMEPRPTRIVHSKVVHR